MREWAERPSGSSKNEHGPVTGAFALGEDAPAHLLGGQRGAVQAETVPILARGKAVRKDAGEILRRDPHAGVDDRDDDRAFALAANAQGEALFVRLGFLHGVLGIAQEIHEDLQRLVLVDGDRGRGVEFAHHGDVVARKTVHVELERILDERFDRHHFGKARNPRIGLLHGHDILDVLDIAGEQLDLGLRFQALVFQMLREIGEIGGQQLALRIIGEELGESSVLVAQRPAHRWRRRRARLAPCAIARGARPDERGGDVHAVEDVADVVEHARGHFRHAGLARGIDELLLRALQFLFRPFALGDLVAQGGVAGLDLARACC